MADPLEFEGTGYIARTLRAEVDAVLGGVIDECEREVPNLLKIRDHVDHMQRALDRARGQVDGLIEEAKRHV